MTPVLLTKSTTVPPGSDHYFHTDYSSVRPKTSESNENHCWPDGSLMTSVLFLLGSRPMPIFRFFVGGRELEPSSTRMSADQMDAGDENLVSTAIIRFVPTSKDHGKFLTCRATNEYFPDKSKEDGYVLNVRCK